MSYPTHDTNWATSGKGNEWRRSNGKLLVVGRKKTGGYWAMIDGSFIPGNFQTQQAAEDAATKAAQPKLHDDWSWE